ncbi:DUF4136 domain-containing protein [Pseudomonas sp. C27(2019)]|uniref:DUF4136 domain-containing protein n=1 Tax=Pseudomonas sp. C27(2019) TaxID=2604941 RepID=UPI001244D221|nr:DUF4136 domain-containing protein [Pseudomonas sp. C27(2019)]QEY59706.1 DUF4136 domain-containing protein [Pseudomonas sp. C27(2019)]
MLRYLILSTAALLLVGCQAGNPYQAESLPSAPAPTAATTHFDSSAYPVKVDRKTYSYWCWHDQYAAPTPIASTENDALRILAEQLEQYGLRAAPSAEQCQLKVQLISSQRQHERRVYDDFPSANYGFGYGHGHPYYDRHRYSGIGVNIPIGPRSYTEHYQQLTLTFTDAQTQQPVWRTQSTVSSDLQGHTTEKALRKAINSMLSSYR